MEDNDYPSETVISGNFVSVHLPTYETSPPNLLTFSVFDEINICSLLTKPYITVDESFGVGPLPPAPKPDGCNNLLESLTQAMHNLDLISPLSINRQPSHQFSSFPSQSATTISDFNEFDDQILENDPKFIELRNKLENIPPISF